MIEVDPTDRRPPTNVFDLDPETFRDWADRHDLPKYLGDQVIRWIYEKGELDPARMTDLSKRNRSVLVDRLAFGEGRRGRTTPRTAPGRSCSAGRSPVGRAACGSSRRNPRGRPSA